MAGAWWQPAGAQAIANLHEFSAGRDGNYPSGALAVAGNGLYGTTTAGGTAGLGAVFRLDLTSGQETVLYSFGGGADAAGPVAGLLRADGTLFGTSYGGGAAGAGTVFKVNPVTGVEKVLYAFSGGADGGVPVGGVAFANHVLYGTATHGGAFGKGAVFKLDLATRAETVLYSFSGGKDGGVPTAGVTLVAGALYGTTSAFGAGGLGTLFSIDLATGQETTLYAFRVRDAGAPSLGALIFANGVLYGTTQGGGGNGMGETCDGNCGSVYRYDPAAGAETVLHRFQGGLADGANPEAPLMFYRGVLYGTTFDGGGFWCNGVGRGCGTVFSLDTRSGAETVLATFSGEGSADAPQGGLLLRNGVLFGTASGVESVFGCSDGCGDVFALTQ
jgi:uncharacterized repeat protein (TIGR03803 family)